MNNTHFPKQAAKFCSVFLLCLLAMNSALPAQAQGLGRSAAAPSIPRLLSPANGAPVNTLQPMLDWKNSSPAADHYQLQVSENKRFTALVIDEDDLPNSTFTPASDLDGGKRYFWRVKAFNAAGRARDWSAIWEFKTPLAKPILISPPDDELLLTDRPDFDWEDVNGATSYKIQVSETSTFGDPLVSATVEQSAYRLIKDLREDKLFCWRVRAITSVVQSGWSDVWCFTTGNPPSVPVLRSPASKVLITNYRPIFKWSTVTVSAGTSFDYYQLQVDDDRAFGSPAVDTSINTQTAPQFRPASDLAAHTKFYWRVRAYNTLGHYSAWSAVWFFRTSIPPPTLLSPANGAIGVPVNPTLDWSDVPRNAGYTLQIWKAGSTPVLVKSVTLDTNVSRYTFRSNLLPNTTYIWKVRTNGVNNPSAWASFQFTTQ